jgi:hypothetical protein
MAYLNELQCDVRELYYDFIKQEGTLNMREDNRCDMTGCIDLFKKIDPRVSRISTFAGGVQDTAYRLNADGRWVACEPIDAS